MSDIKNKKEKKTVDSRVKLYDSQEEKYKDNLSSAFTFFTCGAVGLIIVALNYFGVIKIITKDSSSFLMINIILLLLFVGFIGIGFWSLNYSKKIRKTADKENDLKTDIFDWLTDNITAEDIENSYDNDIAEELKYFSRGDYVRDKLSIEFPDVDKRLISSLADLYIEDLF